MVYTVRDNALTAVRLTATASTDVNGNLWVDVAVGPVSEKQPHTMALTRDTAKAFARWLRAATEED